MGTFTLVGKSILYGVATPYFSRCNSHLGLKLARMGRYCSLCYCLLSELGFLGWQDRKATLIQSCPSVEVIELYCNNSGKSFDD